MIQRFTGLLLLSMVYSTISFSQNVGIGIAKPQTGLHVAGSFLVSQPEVYPVTFVPIEVTMANGSLVTLKNQDSASVLFDPSGPGVGNYAPNTTANAEAFRTTGSIGFRVTISSMQLGAGDSLFITDHQNPGAANTLLAVGNNYNTTGEYIYNSAAIYFLFKSNADGSIGSGFTIRVDQVFTSTAADVNNFAGNGFFVDLNTGAMRVGKIEPSPRGKWSVAFGENTYATGWYSFAMGDNTRATATGAISYGGNTRATGAYSLAGGASTEASGGHSVALGVGTDATGSHSVALGNQTLASGTNSLALGNNTNASGNESVSMGSSSVASGSMSVSMGLMTDADSYGCLALGRYNTLAANPNKIGWDVDDRILVIGDGNFNVRSNLLVVYKNGDAWLQGTLTQASDARLKKNINPLENALEKIMRLGGYHYNWINPTSTTKLQTGLLAQEVQTVMPELVTSDDSGELSVNYTGMIPYLVESIKELKKQNEELQRQFSHLKK